jgi:type III secretion protein N (ATPase)
MSSLNYINKLMSQEVEHFLPLTPLGRVTQVTGTVIKAIAPKARIGDICQLRNLGETSFINAEVIGFDDGHVLLMPMDDINGISSSTEVLASGMTQTVRVGPGLRGRVLSALGEPLDKATKGELVTVTDYPAIANPPEALSRRKITRPITLGVKAIDGLITCGEGQRMGIFATAGIGKSVLLEMMIKHTDADIIVVALIGERGREVREFIEDGLGENGMKNAVIIVATSDRPAIERVKAAHAATAIAEYFRDQGERVLLLMDSMSRYARAQREIGLAAGEVPTRRGYPSSVFAAIPKLLERAGNSSNGSITAFYTVLVEGDESSDPVAEEVRSILDGHIFLSSELSSKSHYPAIDILNSLSRSMHRIVPENHQQAAAKIRRLFAKYNEIELLIRVGEFQAGTDAEADEAIRKIDNIRNFLQQSQVSGFDYSTTFEYLMELSIS